MSSVTERTGLSVDGEPFISACNRWIDFDDDLHLRSFVNPLWSFANLSQASHKEFFCNVP